MSKHGAGGGARVVLNGVGKRYGRAVVLSDVDLDIPAGSFCTFLGPSGSGKTTTLNIVGGLTPPDGGAVHIDQVDATHLVPEKRGLGFVFQSYALFPHMTVAKNVAYPLRMRGIGGGERDRLVQEALELVRLGEIAHRYPSQLSGGQQQRTALARAIVFGPKVLLMDEPLSALDAGLRTHLQREIVRIAREIGCTVLYVTHDQEEALSMSDQIVLFNAGRVEQIGTPESLYRSPDTAFAARFIGNGRLFAGRIGQADHGPVLVGADGVVIPVDAGAVARHGLGAGTEAAAVFRPETISLLSPELTPGNQEGDAHLIARGRIADRIFVGGQVKLIVALDGEQTFECRSDVTRCPWQVGDNVSIGVSDVARPSVVPVPASPAVPAGAAADNQ